jgi:heme-degrading monooxygenase HmoA
MRSSSSNELFRITAPCLAIFSVAVLRRDEPEVTHFMTVTHWETEDSIRAFAGDDLLRARYYPEDQDFLLEFEPRAQHFVVAAFADDA